MTNNTNYSLHAPASDDEWRVYHEIRRKVLFENRGQFGIYDENRPDETAEGHYPLILIYKSMPIAVVRVDLQDDVAFFRRVAVREDMQRAGHGRILLDLAEAFARAKGCNEVRSNVAADAVGFYEHCGYSRDLSMPARSESVPMRKPLV